MTMTNKNKNNQYNENNKYNRNNKHNYADDYDNDYADDYADDYDNNYADDYADDYDNDYADDYADDYDNDYADDYADDYDNDYADEYADDYDDKFSKTEINRNVKYEDDYDDDDFYSEYGVARPPKPVNTKPIIIGIAIAVLAIIAFVVVPKIIHHFKPDAVITTDEMDIITEVTGFDGHATITGEKYGTPAISELKEKDTEYDILDSIEYSDIVFDKSEGLKNGDKVIAKMTMSSSKYKLKFDKDTIEKEITIEGLAELVNSFSELPKDFTDRLDKRAKKKIYDSLYKPDGLKIERVALLEKPMDEAEIYEVGNSSDARSKYRLLGVYKAMFNESDWWSGTKVRKTQYYIMDAYDFQKANGKVISEFYYDGYYDNYDELVNNLGFKGYELLDETKQKEEPKTEEPEDEDEKSDEEDKNAEDDKTDEDDKNDEDEKTDDEDKSAEDDKSAIGKAFEVNGEGNLREDHSLDAAVVVKLRDGAYMNVKDVAHTDDGRTWYFGEASDIDGGMYTGWISSKVLK